MGTDDFNKRLDLMRQRVAALQAEKANVSEVSQELAIALEELHMALEELQVTQEELRQQNEDLIASRQTVEAQRGRYQDLFEFAPDAYLVTDMEGTIWEANQAAAQFLGAEQRYLVGKPLVVFVVEDERSAFHEQVSWLRRLDGRREWEMHLRPRSGGVLDASMKVAAICDRDGRRLGLRWLLRDMTERKHVEQRFQALNQELERRVRERTVELESVNRLKDEWLAREQAVRLQVETAQHRLGFLAEASSVLASSLDYDTILERVTRLAVSHLADWSSIYLIEDDGSITRQAVAHHDPAREEMTRALLRRCPVNPAAPEGIPQVLRTGQALLYPVLTDAILEEIAVDPEHRRIFRELGAQSGMAVPLEARGRIFGALTFAREADRGYFGPEDLALAKDFARRAAAAIDNARLYREVQEADRHKDEFLAMLAHELRNPLAPIRTSLSLLRHPTTGKAETRKAHEIIDRQLQTMSRLVDDLLDVSRITRGKIELRKERVDLATVVKRALEDTRPLIEERRHRLHVSLPKEPVPLEADPTRLEQVFINLLNNAVKYTEPGGRIDLAAERQQDEVVIRIRDTGVGMAPEMLPRVFDLFTQGEQSLDRAEGGLGIGLTLVRSLVELHGGSIRAFSPGTGQGSEFVVRLPVTPAPAPSREEQPEPTGSAGRSLYLLLVDDNVDAAETLGLLIETWGHQVRVAHDAETALKIAQAHPPDVVLLDIGLPKMSGYELAQRLRREAGLEQVLLVAVTGYGREADRQRSREAGFDLHLVKPVDTRALERILAHPEMLLPQREK